MKKKLKILTSSAFILLIYPLFQTAHGMESAGEHSVKRVVARLKQSLVTKPVVSSGSNIDIEKEIKFNILKRAAIEQVSSNIRLGNLKLVCKEWREEIIKNLSEKDNPLWKVRYGILLTEHEQIYRRILEGVLVFRPNQGSNIGRIDIPIAGLKNPLEGSLDLLQCGDAGRYVSISIGYRKREIENPGKMEIWFTPRFLVEKELKGTASRFQGIFKKKWPASCPVGIIWTWGGWKNFEGYSYLTNQSMDELSNNNLYEKMCASSYERRSGSQQQGTIQQQRVIKSAELRRTCARIGSFFTCSFGELK